MIIEGDKNSGCLLWVVLVLAVAFMFHSCDDHETKFRNLENHLNSIQQRLDGLEEKYDQRRRPEDN